MRKYHHVTVIFPNCKKVRGAIKGDVLPPDLARLTYMYGIKVKIGGRVKGPEVARLVAIGRERRRLGREVLAPRPLSPDFGRGSGAPI